MFDLSDGCIIRHRAGEAKLPEEDSGRRRSMRVSASHQQESPHISLYYQHKKDTHTHTQRESQGRSLRSVIALKMSHHAEWLQSRKHTCIHPEEARAVFQTRMHKFQLICNDTHDAVFSLSLFFFVLKVHYTIQHNQRFDIIVSVCVSMRENAEINGGKVTLETRVVTHGGLNFKSSYFPSISFGSLE